MKDGRDDTGRSLSVIIPTRNRPELLRRSVRSAATSATASTEVVVVNDGLCLDRTLRREIEDCHVMLVENGRNLGAAAARNRGVEAASGELISFLDDDDELHPLFCSRIIRDFPQGRAFTWTGVSMTGLEGPVNVRQFKVNNASEEERALEALSIGSGFGLTLRRDDFLSLGGFDEELRLAEDTDFLIRLIESGFDPSPIASVLVKINNDAPDRQTADWNDQDRIAEASKLLRKHAAFFHRFPIFRKQLSATIEWLENKHQAGICSLS